MALCDATGYPTKRVSGKSLKAGGHVWADVFVPVESGYKLLPVDAALGYFGHHNSTNHLFFEYTPNITIVEENGPKDYKLSIEKKGRNLSVLKALKALLGLTPYKFCWRLDLTIKCNQENIYL